MSETVPAPTAAERPVWPTRRTLILWIVFGGIVLGLSCFLSRQHSRIDQPESYLNGAHIREMYDGLIEYSSDHDWRLPPTLRELIPQYLTEERFAYLRYCDKVTGKRADWLYFPKEKLDDLPPGTIVLAGPGSILDGSGIRSRFVWGRPPLADQIPEAEFQRLIREQNPPASK